jgi:hypothetical protein
MAFDFLAYMEKVAKELLAIGHTTNGKKSFFRVGGISSMEELLQGISKADFPALCAVDQPEARLIDRDSSNPLLLNYHYFFILQHAASLDAASRSAAIKECSVIAGKILSRMFRDKLAECRDPFTYPSGLKGLNRDSVSLKSVGPVADNCFGVWVSFTLTSESGIVYNADDWA